MDYYIAPLEGITGYIYRNAHSAVFGAKEVYYTPFLSPSKNKNFTPREKRDILPENNEGVQIVPQILTNQAEYFLRTAKALCEYGYTQVNLNLGCPSGTVVSKKKGAGFLAEPEKLREFFEEVFAHIQMEVSVKTRLGMENAEEFEEILEIFNAYPIKELIIHPRVREDYYKNKPNYEAFQKAVEQSKNPLCYNGDINRKEDFEQIIQRYPTIHAVMCGRGILKNPALYLSIRGEGQLTKENLLQFHERVYEGYQSVMSGDKNILFKMKELWGYLGESFEDSEKYIKRIRKAEGLLQYEAEVSRLLRERPLRG